MGKKLRWYQPRSRITTNKTEANKIATTLRGQGNFKNVRVVPRVLMANKRTMTPRTKGFWLKVKK